MSTNSNFKQDKCWSCEFFSGNREYKKGWFGDSVETADWGICTNQKNFLDKNQKVQSSGWCSCYQKWGVLQSAIAMQEQKKAQEQAEREQRQAFERQERENQRQQEELRAERFRLEAERKRLEYERWYNSLSEEERKQEDERKEQERLKAEELRKQREEEYKRQEEQRKIKEIAAKRKNKYILIGTSIAFILLACLFITIFFISEHKTSLELVYDYYITRDPKVINELQGKITMLTVFMVLEIIGVLTTILLTVFKVKKNNSK